MATRRTTRRVLLLDNDLGFAIALSEELQRREIAGIPAASLPEAETLLGKFRLNPDLVIVNCALPKACAFAESVAAQRPGVKLLGITSERHQCRECAGQMAATFRDPEDRGPEKIAHCAGVIETLLERPRGARGAGNR